MRRLRTSSRSGAPSAPGPVRALGHLGLGHVRAGCQASSAIRPGAHMALVRGTETAKPTPRAWEAARNAFFVFVRVSRRAD